MGRPTVNINPIRGQRLKIILNEQNITQEKLSKMINLTQQTLSQIIKGKANLTEDRAKDIIDLFPEYAPEWLLGYSNCKYLDGFDMIEDFYEAVDDIRRDGFIEGIKKVALHCGYRIIFEKDRFTVNKDFGYLAESDGESLSISANEDLNYQTFDDIILNEFIQDVEDFFKERLSKLCTRGH